MRLALQVDVVGKQLLWARMVISLPNEAAKRLISLFMRPELQDTASSHDNKTGDQHESRRT